MPIPSTIPGLIPGVGGGMTVSPALPASGQFSLYDVAIGGLPFVYANSTDDPLIRQTAPFEKERIDQAETPGEQTLTGWWLKSQESFHGGAGQKQLEPAVPTPVSHVRYDISKNVDVFTPGQVTRLPDTAVVSSGAAPSQMVGITVSGADAIIYIDSSHNVQRITSLDSSPVTSAFTGSGVSNITSIASDGLFVYAVSHANVYKLDPSNLASVTTLYILPATLTDGVLGWAKARLMLGAGGVVYGLDVSIGSSHTLVAAGTDPYYLYTHPTVGFVWRCFSESATAILAAGDAGGTSIILQFDTQVVSGSPTLSPDGQIAQLPIGERILSMLNIEGSYLGIGTTRGVRVGSFDSYFSRLTYGPLELLPTDPTIPCYNILSRDRFLYAVGMAYDEGGLIAIDLGTKTDDAGRFAWSPHLITPAFTTSSATAACVLPGSSRIAFYVTGTGIVLEGTAAGENREAYVQTSRIRFDTTEPKLFKLGRVRGDLTTGEIVVTGITAAGPQALGTFGFVDIDPDEFKLPTDPVEWLQLKMALAGASTTLTSYGVKALPGTRRQRQIQPVLSCFDHEVSKNDIKIDNALSARSRLEALEAIDAAGDEVLFQEFTPSGVVSTIVIIKQLKFTQSARPTKTSDIGGIVAVLLQTVEG